MEKNDKKMKTLHLKVAAVDKGLRLDQFIIRNLELAVSRSRIQRLINEGEVTINQKPAKAHYKVKENDTLLMNIPEPSGAPQVLPEKIPLKVIFEDDDILVIDKPPGMVTHPAVGNYSHTLVNALLNYGCGLSTVNGPLRPGIVHRLDKDTSGLLVIAKSDFSHLNLAEQFRRHTVKRKYIALVKGRVGHNEGNIDYPLARDPQDRRKFTVGLSGAKDARTQYRVLERYRDVTLLELSPYTGRTHQLRVHLKFYGHPILGDVRYGSADRFERLTLHATVLGFRHPRTGEFVEFNSDIPECFKVFLRSFNNK